MDKITEGKGLERKGKKKDVTVRKIKGNSCEEAQKDTARKVRCHSNLNPSKVQCDVICSQTDQILHKG